MNWNQIQSHWQNTQICIAIFSVFLQHEELIPALEQATCVAAASDSVNLLVYGGTDSIQY